MSRCLTIVLTLLLASACAGPIGKPAVTEMPLSERAALECKYQLAQMGSSVYDDQHFSGLTERARRSRRKRNEKPLTRRHVRGYLGLKCPAGKAESYSESLLACVGKPRGEAVIICQGEHHQKAGYAPDYPRWIAGKGVIEEPSGAVLMPSGCDLPLPEDAQLVDSSSKPGSGRVELILTTEKDLEELAQRYHKLLNAGADFVQAPHGGSYGVGGKLNHIPYNISLVLETKEMRVRWEPIIDDDRVVEPTSEG